jgi:type II secretory pathway pseudopilin PulG
MKSIWTFVIVGVLVATVGLGVYVSHQRKKAQLREVSNYLEQVYLALSSYDAEHRGIPAPVKFDDEGKPLYSWRFELFPFLEAPAHPIHAELPWNAPEHAEWRELVPPYYCLLPGRPKKKPETTGSVYAIVGAGTPFSWNVALRLRELPPDTILLIETTTIGKHWMEPGDFDIDRLEADMIVLGHMVTGEVPGVVHVVFADGQVWGLSSKTPLDKVRAFFVRTQGERSRERSLLPYRVN